MIEVVDLTKRYGDHVAVDNVNFTVEPGRITGFLGPNGAGKSTTMRIILGLDQPSSGHAHVQGRSLREERAALVHVGALLDPHAIHPGRSGRAHLRIAAAANGISRRRVEEVLEEVGLGPVGDRQIREYSLGMLQRLGIGAALLGQPQTVVFDEVMNGLDLDGVRWIRGVLTDLARAGCTVLVSSHLMSEMEQIADQLIIIGRGRVLAEGSLREILGAQCVRARSPHLEALQGIAARAGWRTAEIGEVLEIHGATSAEVGEACAGAGVVLHHLSEERRLEEAYLALTEGHVEHSGAAR